MKKCPYCAEPIQDEAIVCRYCGRELLKAPPAPPVENAPARIRPSNVQTVWLSIVTIAAAMLMISTVVWAISTTQENYASMQAGERYDSTDGSYATYSEGDYYRDTKYVIIILLVIYTLLAVGVGGSWFFHARGGSGMAYTLSVLVLLTVAACGFGMFLVAIW